MYFEEWEKTAASFTKAWEEAASRSWDTALRDAGNLRSMGTLLSMLCEAKERCNRALDEVWARWRLPSAADMERIHERLGELHEQLGHLEERLAMLAPSSGGGTDGAKEKRSADA